MSFLDNVLSGLAYRLKTLSGVVDVSEAPAPEPGQVLTALDATHAEWADPSGGGGGGGGYVIADALSTGSGDPAEAVDVSGSPIPTAGQVLIAQGADAAAWRDPVWLPLDEFGTSNTVICAIDGDGGLGPVPVYMPPSTVLMRGEDGDLFAGQPTDVATLLSGQALNDSAAVPKALFDANTVLTADVDNTPHALTMPPSTVLTRLASGNIKAATVAELQALLSIGGTAGSVATDINPAHWYRGDNTLSTGGLVDQITDAGTIPKHFTQTGAARCPVAVDGNGRTYLAPDGIADFYIAGVLADWKFLSDGSPWTVAIIYQRNAVISGQETILDNNDGTTGAIGLTLFQLFVSAGVQGPALLVTNGTGGQAPLTVESLTLSTNLSVVIIRHTGDNTANANGSITPTPVDVVMRRMGALVSFCNKKFNFSSTNPSFPMTLFRRSNTADRFTSSRLYELILDNKAWSDRQVSLYEAYAKSQYNIAV